MAAYVIAEVEVVDPAGYDEYRKGVPATIAAYGGKFLVRGGAVDTREGGWAPKRIVVLEFESVARARAWYESPEYRPLLALRERAAKSKLIIAEGL
jgi:uncharacterized protein (DUF1330 family)